MQQESIDQESHSIVKIIVYSAIALIVLTAVSLLIVQRTMDGPNGPIPGGAFETGEISDKSYSDWQAIDGQLFEFYLAESGMSRTLGAVVFEGNAYITCDLGFISRRAPSGQFILGVLRTFKNWHLAAVENGRAVFRIDGVRYPQLLVKVDDPILHDRLLAKMEQLAASYFDAPMLETPRNPEEMWFFRIESIEG